MRETIEKSKKFQSTIITMILNIEHWNQKCDLLAQWVVFVLQNHFNLLIWSFSLSLWCSKKSNIAVFAKSNGSPQNPILSTTISQYQKIIVTATFSSKPWDCSMKNYDFITSLFEARQGKWHFLSIIFNVERVSYLKIFCKYFLS